jgi:hypothetical protein
MKRFVLSALIASVAGIGSASAAGICNVPDAEWQPKEALQKKLEGEGWSIKTIKIDEGCYEVYGKDAAGNRMETYFDPKSFEVKKQD